LKDETCYAFLLLVRANISARLLCGRSMDDINAFT
jgi:hypothetical protein